MKVDVLLIVIHVYGGRHICIYCRHLDTCITINNTWMCSCTNAVINVCTLLHLNLLTCEFMLSVVYTSGNRPVAV